MCPLALVLPSAPLSSLCHFSVMATESVVQIHPHLDFIDLIIIQIMGGKCVINQYGPKSVLGIT